MAQQEGPFSSYLDYMQKPIAPAPTGLEGTGMGIANIAMNFLQGLRQGRAQKYMQKEAEESRKEQLLLNAMQTVQRSGMLPEAKAQYEARIQQEFAKRVAGVKEGSKDTGNPLTDFFKRAGMSLIGGQPPGGKKADIDMNVALEAFAAASDPRNSISEELSRLEREAHEEYKRIAAKAQGEGRPITDEDLNKSTVLSQIDSRVRSLRPTSRTPLESLRSSTVSGLNPYQVRQLATQEAEAKQKAEALNLYDVNKDELEGGVLSPQVVSNVNRAAVILKRQPPKISTVYVKDQSGKILLADQVEGHSGLSGFYDPSTRKIIPGAAKASQIDINRGSPEALSKAAQSAADNLVGLMGAKNPLYSTYAGALNTARSPEDINRITLNAVKSFMEQEDQKYREQKDTKNFTLALNKAENALPAQKQLNNVESLYSAVMAKYKNPEIRELMKTNPILRTQYQGLLINLIAKAVDPDSVIRPNEFQQWAEKAGGVDRLNLWIQSQASGSKILLRPEDEDVLLGIADDLISSLKTHVAEEKETLRKGLRSTQAIPEEATPANRPPPADYTPPVARREVKGYNPKAK